MGDYDYRRRNKGRKRKLVYKAKKNFDDEKIKKMNKIKYNERIGNYDKAISLDKDFIEEYPDDNYAHIYLAKLYQKKQDYNMEKQLLIKILEERTLNKKEASFVNFLYGGLLAIEENFDLAIEFFKEGIEDSDDLELVARKDLAGVYVRKQDIDKALDILTIDGFNNQFLNNERARVYSRFNKHKLALKALDSPVYNDRDITVVENFDDSFIEQDKNYIKGHCLFKLFKYDEAIEELEKALSYKTRDVYYQSTIDLIRIYIAKGKLDRASLLCDDVLKSDLIRDKYADTIKKLNATIYQKAQNYEKALNIYSNPMSPSDTVNLAYILYNSGKLEEAEKLYESVNITNLPIDDYYEAFLKYALVETTLGKHDKSNEIIEYLLNSNNKSLKVERITYILKRLKVLNDTVLGNELEEREYSYSEKQIINYSEEEAIKHIYEHHFLIDSFTNFNKDIDCRKLFEFASEKIKEMKPVHEEIFDRYIIDYDDIGYSIETGEKLNQLEVITILNTKRIITMYPSKFLKVRMFEEDDYNSKKPIKKMSRVEWFKAKYGIE